MFAVDAQKPPDQNLREDVKLGGKRSLS